MLQDLLYYLSGKGLFPEWLDYFRVKGKSISRVKWFVLDLSEGTVLC